MDLKGKLKDFDKSKVDVFINYLNNLAIERNKKGELVNWWVKKVSEADYVSAFKKVISQGLFIDGDTITLNFRGKLLITYDYHAYMNKIKLSYPKTKFDFGLVYENDNFKFSKKDGYVNYTHDLIDPFKIDKKIIGAYGIIKNSKGEFLETINISDIEKFKNTSTMKFIWNNWYDRMVLKSVIKRICSIHFKDIVKDIDDIDNETNEPERAILNTDILDLIDNAVNEIELTDIYKKNISKVNDKQTFINQLANKKKELKDG